MIEITVKKRGKDGWKEHLEETKGKKDSEMFVDEIIYKYGYDHRGSYQLIVKLNCGAGKNPETGLTMISNLKGKLGMICSFVSASRGDAK